MLTQSIDDSPPSPEAHNHESIETIECAALLFSMQMRENVPEIFSDTHIMQEYLLLLEMQLMLLEPSAKTKAD